MGALVVLPGLDGTSTYFRHVAACLDRPVVYCDAPGVFEGVPLETVEALARCLLKQLPPTPFDLVGWSFASMLAHHLAWLLEADHTPKIYAIDPLWPARLGRQHPQQTADTAADTGLSPVTAANRRAMARFRPRPIHGETDYLLTASNPVPTTVFETLHRGRYHTVPIEGDHNSCLCPPHAQQLAHWLAP